VLDGVDRRQTTSQALEIAWWGWTSLVLEFVQGLFQVLGVREDKVRDDSKKEG
jgi:hypothetical protein